MTKSSPRSRRFKAILAGGIVLGVGAAVTLAAWTDDEWTEGVFGAGSFNVEGSTTGAEGTFADHESVGGAADLSFDLSGADNLSPNTVVVAPFVVRLDAETTSNASIVLTSASGDGANANALTYGIVGVASADACTPGATGEEIVPAGTDLDSAAGAQEVELEAGNGNAAGPAATLCVKVTADSTLSEGDGATAQWHFTATSID